MSRISTISLLLVLFIVIAAGAMFGTGLSQPVAAQPGGPGGAGAGSYSVVMTDGTHLVVTDNKNSTLYFYSIDKDAAIGSDLKLRGKLDLTQVGKDTLHPVVMFKKEKN
jgi:hypothetical protein